MRKEIALKTAEALSCFLERKPFEVGLITTGREALERFFVSEESFCAANRVAAHKRQVIGCAMYPTLRKHQQVHPKTSAALAERVKEIARTLREVEESGGAVSISARRRQRRRLSWMKEFFFKLVEGSRQLPAAAD